MHADRKHDHLRICADKDTRSGLSTGLEAYHLVHCALPELSLAAIDTATTFLGRPLSAPLLISAMTGGVPEALDINRNLARMAQALGVAMGLGSQRAGLDTPGLMSTYQVRDVAPDILLLANLGAVQLVHGHGVDDCRRIVDAVAADALVLHLNPLQEALQPEGDTDFGGLLAGIAAVCNALTVPVIVKEVGWGISAVVAERLQQAGVAAIDVSGAGGTSWSKVEGQRAATSQAFEVTCAFDDWGLPTAEALLTVRKRLPHLPLIASGGIRDGVQVAKCLALGAQLVGIAHALLAPALDSAEAVEHTLTVVLRQLRIAMFCTGCIDLAALDASRITTRTR